MNYTGQTSFAEMFEYYCNRNVTNEREYNEREMLRWLKQQLQQAHRDATEEVAKAHKRGWEQAKREALCAATLHLCNPVGEKIADAIASMEYKEKANDR